MQNTHLLSRYINRI